MVTVPKSAIKTFASQKEWRTWLRTHHDTPAGVWLRLYKKDSGKKSFSHAEALEEALCFGWIDGLGKKYDIQSWIIKFTPRRAKSVWSKRNCEHVIRLTKAKRMTRYGLAQVALAKADGRWAAAYDSPKDMKVPADFIRELKKTPKAYAFFQTLNKTNTYAIAWRLQTAKQPATRQRRMAVLVDKMKRGEKLY